jgi:hypothetical protein
MAQTTNAMPSPNTDKADIAATAARLVVEEGLEFGPAKRRALKELGMNARTALPGNEALETEVRQYIALFCAETQPGELRALREHACMWMTRLAAFRPHIGGAVWRGTATRLNDIYIQLFCDDCKEAEFALIDQQVKYEAQRIASFNGEMVDVLSLHSFCRALNEEIGVHLMVHDFDALRGALHASGKRGRAGVTAGVDSGLPRAGRGDLASLRRLLDGDHQGIAGEGF